MPARAQTGFDRPGGDYSRFTVQSGDPAVCSARCERDGRCRAWTFSYPGTAALGGSNVATCWLKNQVKPLVENSCCASGVKGAALVEMRPGRSRTRSTASAATTATSRCRPNQDVEACKQACEDENRCRAWSYCAAGLRRRRRRAAILKDKITRAAAPAVLHVGRGAVAASQPVPPTVMRSMRSVGWPTPTGTPWPFLPQVPTPVSSLQSLPTMRDALEVGRSVADQHRALERRAELAVLDLVAPR